MAQGAIRVLQTVQHRCGYFADKEARNIVVDPKAAHPELIYDSVVSSGFRRAGQLIFRPHCQGCQACVSTRVPVATFRPTRIQRRCLKRNTDLELRQERAGFSEEFFQLYRIYVNHRHPKGGMDRPARDDFGGFLLSRWSRTFFLTARHANRLLAVAAVDRLANGLSAVYTFFDPEESRRSLGTFAILAQIELARRLRLPYVYLGYWIEGHGKMHYKTAFRPIEIFVEGQWREYDKVPENETTGPKE